MTSTPTAFHRRDTIPIALALSLLALSRVALFLLTGLNRLRRAELTGNCRGCLREYAGPLGLVIPLALVMAFVRTPPAAQLRDLSIATPVISVQDLQTAASPLAVEPPMQGALRLDTAVASTGAALTPTALQALPSGTWPHATRYSQVSQGERGSEAASPMDVDTGLFPDTETSRGNPSMVGAGQIAAATTAAKAATTYRVQQGDTAGDIAERFGVTVDTVLSANDISDPAALQIGQELTIPPVSGVVHTVTEGDTLVEIAALYGVEAASISAHNALPSEDALQIGAKLMVPEGKIPVARAGVSSRGGARPVVPTGTLQWPTVGGISTYFGSGHRGLDIMGSMGAPVYAADGGTVVTAIKGAYDYGHYLVVDHGNGLRTLYSHLSAFYVDYGDKVGKGEAIGAIGTTGLSTGPHLHLEVWKNGAKTDPLDYLP